MFSFKSFIFSLWFLVLLHPSAAQSGSGNEKQKKKPNAVATLKLIAPTRTQYSSILIAIGSTVEFKWEWEREPAEPVEGFNLILVRNVPNEVIYPIATNLSASTFSYSWNTEEYNNNPENQNQLIQDNKYMLFIYNSNYTTYKHPAKFGEFQPYSTQWAFFDSKEPSTKYTFNNGFKSCTFNLFFVNFVLFLYLIN